jgi:ribulose-bisphosphate carboxylase large chain
MTETEARIPYLDFCGDRIVVTYHLTGTAAEAKRKAREITIEQTVEFPPDLIARPDIPELIYGKIRTLEELRPGLVEAKIEYAVEIVGDELTQFLNVLFGNSSLKPGIRLMGFEAPESFLKMFKGPRFGRDGLRKLLGVPKRPLLCTALKPMGLSPQELAALAYQFALGGIDFIKDDHGLADQPFCPFKERVSLCAEAVAKANRETGHNCLYLPNITAPAHKILDNARWAKQAGAGGVMVAPGLTGLDTLRLIAEDDDVALPILSHPALQGTFTVRPGDGIAHGALFGQLNRLAGADACVFPHFGGRFSFSEAECRDLVDGTERPMGQMPAIFPVPAGGMSLDRVQELYDFYGADMILLIGGDLHRHGPDLAENCRTFARLAGSTVSG